MICINLITFGIIKKTMKLFFFFFNRNSFFKKVQRITLSCRKNHRTLAERNHRILAGRNHRTLAGRCFSVINSFSSSKNSYYFLTKNNSNIKVETKKTPTAVANLLRKSRFQYIEISIYNISLRKRIWSFENLKTFDIFFKESTY